MEEISNPMFKLDFLECYFNLDMRFPIDTVPAQSPSINLTFSELCGANYLKDRNLIFFAINHIFPK